MSISLCTWLFDDKVMPESVRQGMDKRHTSSGALSPTDRLPRELCCWRGRKEGRYELMVQIHRTYRRLEWPDRRPVFRHKGCIRWKVHGTCNPRLVSVAALDGSKRRHAVDQPSMFGDPQHHGCGSLALPPGPSLVPGFPRFPSSDSSVRYHTMQKEKRENKHVYHSTITMTCILIIPNV